MNDYPKNARVYYIPDEEDIQEDILERAKKNAVTEMAAPSKKERTGQESWPEYFKRIGGQLGLRSAELALGTPGELAKMANSPFELKNKLLSAATPESVKEQGIDFGEILKSPSEMFFFGPLAEQAKTREDFREYGKKIFGDKFEPKTEFEKRLGEGTQDFLSLLTTRNTGSITRNILSAAGTSLIGNTTKETLRQFGAGKNAQEIGKASSMVLSSLINPRLVTNYFTQQYQAAENAIPRGAVFFTSPSERRNLLVLRNQIERDITSRENQTAGRLAIQRIDEFLDRVAPNNVGRVEDAFRFRRAVNSDFDALGPYYFRLVQTPRRILDNYGRSNPEFARSLREADLTYSAYADSRRLANNIRNMTNFTPQSVTGHAILKILEGKPATIATIGGSFAGLKTYELLYRAIQSPTVARLYGRTMGAAAANNTPAFISNFNKLVEEVDKIGSQPDIKKVEMKKPTKPKTKASSEGVGIR